MKLEIFYLILAFLAGFAVLELEILGTRFISPIYGSTIYVWTSMITVTLVGLAIGYWWGGELVDKNKIGKRELQLILLIIGAYILFLPIFSKFVIKNLFFYFSIVSGPLIISFLLFFFPFILLAMVIPSVTRLITSAVEEVGRKVGKVSAFETVGSLAGGLLTGYYIILHFGIIVTCAVTGIAFIISSLFFRFENKLLVFLLFPFIFYLILPKEPSIVIFHDQGYSDIKVIEQKFGPYMVRQLILDNAVQSVLTDDPNYFNYINFFRIPFFFRKISKVLMVGLGGGLGVRMLGEEYNVSIETVEIDPKVKLVAERYFGFDSSKYPVIINDGRNYLLSTNKKYDLIILDIAFVDWIPYMFTTNFYKIVKEHLNKDGCFIVNVFAIAQGNDFLARSIYSDLKRVFDDVLIFRNPKYPLSEWDNTFFLACDGELEINALNLDENIFLHKIIKGAFGYEKLFDFENRDDFIAIERESLKIRELYFEFAKKEIEKVI